MTWKDRLRHVDCSTKLPAKARFEPEPHAEFYAGALTILMASVAAQARHPLVFAWRVSNITLVAVALVVLGWGILQVEDRALPIDAGPPVLLTTDVPAGGTVKVRFVLTRLRVCAVDVGAIIFDGADEPRPLVTEHRDAGGPLGPDHFTRSFPVPPDATPGQARLRVVWSYTCPGNYAQVLSPIPLAFPDIPFAITAPRSAG